MKNTLIILSGIFIITLLGSAVNAIAGDTAVDKIAVMELKPLWNISKEKAVVLTEQVRSTIASTGKYEVLKQEDMKKMLGEEKFSKLIGCSELNCRLMAGKELGVSKVLYWGIASMRQPFKINMTILDVKKASVDKNIEYENLCSLNDVSADVTRAVYELVDFQFNYMNTDTAKMLTKGCQRKSSDNRLCDHGDGTITDLKTGLMWARKDNGYDINYENAKKYCDSLELAGYKDWRLPTIDELEAIYDCASGIELQYLNEKHKMHISSLFHRTCWWTWTSSGTTVKNAFGEFQQIWAFNFLGSKRKAMDNVWVKRFRAMPVRNITKPAAK